MKKIRIIVFLLVSWSTASAQNIFPTPSGNVGIGTTSPSTLLQLRKDISTAMSASYTYSNDISGIRFSNLSTTSNAGVAINFQLGATGTSHAAIAASRPSADHNILHFYTEHANSIAERMRINSDGNVGIGTTNPAKKLEIKGDDGVGIRLFNQTANTWDILNSQYGKLDFVRGGSNIFMRIDQNGNVGIGTTNPTKKLEIKGDDGVGIRLLNQAANSWDILNSQYGKLDFVRGSSNIFMRIDQNGNVGIGTTAPSKKLEVRDGDIRILRLNGDAQLQLTDNGVRNWYMRVVDGVNRFTIADDATEFLTVNGLNGNVGIGTSTPQSKLAVNGQIRATEVKVLANINVPDYVFEDDYELRTLEETKEYITENKHLPEIPSAAEIGKNGIDIGKMNMRLLKKIEELTLYQIELLEQQQVQNAKIEKMEKKLLELTN